MKKIMLLLIISIFIISLVGALTVEQCEDVDLSHPVRLDGFPSSAIACNITVLAPNNTVIVDFQNMSRSSNYDEYNYTLTNNKTCSLGIYVYDITCTTGNSNKTESFEFEVTPTGYEKLGTGEGIVYIFFLIMVLIIFTLTLYGAIKIPWKNKKDDSGKIISVNDLKWIKLICMVLTYLELIFITTITYELTAGYLYLGGVSGFFYVIHRILIAGLYPAAVVVPWLILVLVIADKKTKKMIRRGLPMR